VVRIPGGKPVAVAIAIVGFAATVLVIAGSVIPEESEPNKVLAVVKVVLLSALLVLLGAVLYRIGKRKQSA
jgi:peptidoglycan/LPS O-acetylase OafA/YrhL